MRSNTSSVRREGRAVLVGAVIVATLVAASTQAISYAAAVSPVRRPVVDLGNPVPVRDAPAAPAPGLSSTSVVAPPPVLPAAGTYGLALPAAVAKPAAAGSAVGLAVGAHGGSTQLGAWRGVGATGISLATRSTDAAAAAVQVQVLDRATAQRYGSSGLALRVSTNPSTSSAAGVAVRVPARMLQGLFGADYAGRVRWVQTPLDTSVAALPRASATVAPPGVTASTAPQSSHAVGVPSGVQTTQVSSAPSSSVSGSPARAVGSVAQLTGQVVAAAVADPGSQSVVVSPLTGSRSFVLAASSGGASANGSGSFVASPLRVSASWQVSAQSGDFSWSYPLSAPPSAAGPSPGLALSYDSQSVDGQTGSTNNQTSELGQGWELSGGGFIERSFVPCSADDGVSGAVAGSGDLCWSTSNATVSVAGHSGQLLRASNGTWRLAADDGSRFEYLTGAVNGTRDGGYWRLTTTDGTQYFFGRDRLPGWKTGDPSTAAAWSVPVFGDDPGEPCHASSFAASSCAQGWRWNLDYVVDPHGNSEAFYYQAETNFYHSAAGPAAYVRGGFLLRIDYGMRAGHELSAPAPQRVVFDNAARCVAASCGPHASWPDTPWDLVCASVACAGPGGQTSPTFFTGQRFAAIHTQLLVSGSTYRDIDTWGFVQAFPLPGDGTAPALWLARVVHTGTGASPASAATNGVGSISTPVTVFYGVTMQNRVWAVDGLVALDKYRISSIDTDTGAVVAVNYSLPDCTPGHLPAAPQNNAMRCFPQWWTPQTIPAQGGQWDWFHKYVVTSVISYPYTGGPGDTAPDETSYDYIGTPAWRYDNTSTTPKSQRTWSMFAGYSAVRVRHGDVNDPSRQQTTTYTFFQGLNGDRAAPAGGTRKVNVVASDGSSAPDSLWLAGRVREQTVSDGFNGPRVSNTITAAWASPVTAGSGALTARMVADADVVTRTALSTGGNRVTEIKTSYDQWGRPVAIDDFGDSSTAADDTCTRTSYATNTTAWLMRSPSRATVVGTRCSATPSYPTDAISAVRSYYDGSTILGAAPSRGDVTRTDTVNSYTGSAPHWQTISLTSYDALGRPIAVTDPRTGTNRTTSTAYVPAAGGPLTQTVVTNPLGWTTTTSYDPAWGAETSLVDENGHRTDATYDALGRRTQVWLPDRLQSDYPALPSMSYVYTLSATAPNTVATTRVVAGGGDVTTYALYDGLLRPRQTQAPSEGGGQVVTDTFYDSAGQVSGTNNAYFATGDPSSTLLVPTTTVPSSTQTVFDGDGRKTADITLVDNHEQWRTSYAYGGDHVNTTPPAGGTPTTTYTDARGNTTRLLQYHASTASGAADTTRYGYDDRGGMTSMTDPAGNKWTWTFDVLGRQISAHDPDSGTSATSYDPAGRVAATTDATGSVLAYSYDVLDRKTAEYSASIHGAKLAAWTYDPTYGNPAAQVKGQLGSATRYVGSTASALGTAYTTSVTGYDPADRPTGQTISIPASAGILAGRYTTSQSYEPDGSIASHSDPAAGRLPAEYLRYGYSGLGNPTGLSTIDDSYLGGVDYTHIGQIAGTTQGSSGALVETSNTWDTGTGRLDEHLVQRVASQGAVVSDDSYTYDDAGDVTSDTNATPGPGTDTQCYRYDYLQRLTQAWTPSNGCVSAPAAASLAGPAPYWQNYSYDLAGNRVGVVDHSSTGGRDSTSTYRYAAPSSTSGLSLAHAVSSVVGSGAVAPTESYRYDKAGRAVTRPGVNLTYDAEGHLTSAVSTNGKSSERRIYDADGNLLLQTGTSGSTLYLGDTELHAAPGAKAASGVRTYSLLGAALAQRTSAAAAAGSRWVFLDTDLTGTANASVNSDTNEPTRRYSDPFGNPRGPNVAWPSDHDYLNAPTDSLTGTTHLGARDYDPSIGQFLTVDPVLTPLQPQQSNGYAYAWNNPTTKTDPTGQCPKDLCGDAGPAGNMSASYTGSAGGKPSASSSYTFDDGKGGNGGGQAPPAAGNSGQRHSNQYRYTYEELIGPVSRTGSPESALPKFMAGAREVFPFPISGCDDVAVGASCMLHPGPHWPGFIHGNGLVDVSEDDTSFTFTVMSDDYFDEPGSTITFRLSDRGGDLFLTQQAVGDARNVVLKAAAPAGAWADWQVQADNLRTLLDPPKITDLVPIDKSIACSMAGVTC
jgi:RHS repeat-associated protein